MEKNNDMDGFVPSTSFVVEKIVGFFVGEDMRKYYQIQVAPTWERAENLIACEKLIESFFNQNGLTTLKENTVLDATRGSADLLDATRGSADLLDGTLADSQIERNTEHIHTFDIDNEEKISTSSHYGMSIQCEENPKVFIVNSNNALSDATLARNSHCDDNKEDSCLSSSSAVTMVGTNFRGGGGNSLFTYSPFHKGCADVSQSGLLINTAGRSFQPIEHLSNLPGKEIAPTNESFAAKRQGSIASVDGNELPHVKNVQRVYTGSSTVRDSIEIMFGKDNSQKVVSTEAYPDNSNEHISFESTFDLKQNQKSPMDKQSLTCMQCNIQFDSVFELRFHEKKHSNERTYKCKECGKTFPRNYDLKRHKYLHSQDYIYECSVCKRKFKYSQQLKTHMRIHTGERPYKCNLCDKTFYCNGNLHNHKQTHTIERNFKCKQCSKAFKLKGNLRRHEKQHLTLL